jgi:aminopeptidase N
MRRGWVAVAVAIALALAGCTGAPPSPAGSASAAFEAGADGLGDAYYPKAGNGGYDVSSYDLDLRYDPGTDVLSGTAVITARATANLNRFNLDFVGLKADKVTVADADAVAEQSGAELVVTPPANIVQGTQFVVKVQYGGVPKGYEDRTLGDVGFLHTDDGALAIGEPEVAATWFPVNDHPRDKATYTIKIAAPDGLSALSNGLLKDKKSAGGFTTWTWSVTKPMASYLATVVIGNYRLQETTHDGKPVLLAVDSSLPADVDRQMTRTAEVIDYLASRFGPYPFDAMGGIVIDDQRIRFALENQTRPLYAPSFFDANTDGAWVLVHELAHQWYGDSVSVNDWKEIWLNEGFATYAEWLWFEDKGQRTAQHTFDGYYAQAQPEVWQVKTGDPGQPDLFDNFGVYIRGAMTLHALRVTVGDAAFFAILKAWAAEKADKNATTPEFIALAERISGKQLDQLFQDWLYGTTRPPRPSP